MVKTHFKPRNPNRKEIKKLQILTAIVLLLTFLPEILSSQNLLSDESDSVYRIWNIAVLLVIMLVGLAILYRLLKTIPQEDEGGID